MAGYLKSKRTDRMNRRVHNAMAELDRRERFHVYDADGDCHGDYASLAEARGCVSFDGLTEFQIIRGDWQLVEQVSA